MFMKVRSWLDDEPSGRAAVAQAARLLLTGVKRLRIFSACVGAFVALVLGVAWVSKPSYAPSVVLRIVEADDAPAELPRPRRELAEYVRQGIFTAAPLLALVRQHGLYPGLASKNPRAALESFREDLDVTVQDNYFVEDRHAGAPPRSARLSITFHGNDPDVAVQVTRALATLIVDHETRVRRDEARRAFDRARREMDALDHVIASRRAAIFEPDATQPRDGGGLERQQIERVDLLGTLPALDQRRDLLMKRASTLSLGAAFATDGLGMSFDVVDDGSLSTEAERRDSRPLFTALSFVLGIPLIAMAVGAFGPTRGGA
jgi:hypothetical protein